MEGIFIFVLDRGFVVVGEAEPHPEKPFWWRMARSATIRRWGTSNGLAELKDGPLPSTILDPVVERLTPDRSVIDVIVPTEKGVQAWRQVLNATGSRPSARR